MTTVSIQFVGGGFDGLHVTPSRAVMSSWAGVHPLARMRLARTEYFYQGVERYQDGDEAVTMRLVGVSWTLGYTLGDDPDDEAGYDGWLSPTDRYRGGPDA